MMWSRFQLYHLALVSVAVEITWITDFDLKSLSRQAFITIRQTDLDSLYLDVLNSVQAGHWNSIRFLRILGTRQTFWPTEPFLSVLLVQLLLTSWLDCQVRPFICMPSLTSENIPSFHPFHNHVVSLSATLGIGLFSHFTLRTRDCSSMPSIIAPFMCPAGWSVSVCMLSLALIHFVLQWRGLKD